MRFGILLVASLAVAQTRPEFEVATIKPSAPQPIGQTNTRMDWNSERLNFSYVNLKQVIGQAYRVQQYQISGPGWLETERFDITAKLLPGSSSLQVAQMLQALLADRFKMTIHRETKELPVYALVVAKGGPKLKSSESDYGISSNSNRASRRVTAKATMERFAEFLSEETGRPVFDQTGLTGSYDFAIEWAVDDVIAPNDSSVGPSLFTALQEHLGLKLDSTKGPVEIVVVDHAARAPSEN